MLLPHRFARLSFTFAVSTAAYACGGEGVTSPATTGTLEITTSTSGTEQDADGYSVQIDAGAAQAVGAAATFTAAGLSTGTHTVRLGEIAANCSVSGDNPRTVSVTAGETTTATFAVTCTAMAGGLTITVVTSGPSPDPDGYLISIDGTDRGALAVNATSTVTGVNAGPHSVTLAGVSANCVVVGENPRTVTVQSEASLTLDFAVTCFAPGALRWQAMASGARTHFSGVWGSSGSNVFAVGEPVGGSSANIFRYDGQRWSEQPPAPGDLRGIWGSSASDVFGVGFAGEGSGLLHYNGSAWSEMTGPVLPQMYYDAVWGTSSSDVYAVGTYFQGLEKPVVAHYNGSSWSQIPVSTRGDATDVHGTSSHDVFVTGFYFPGDGYYVLHYDGVAWGLWGEDAPGLLLGVWANSPSDVFAVGMDANSGMIVHYDGREWSHMVTPPISGALLDVWGTSGSNVYAVSANAILHYDGTSWTQVFGQGGSHIWGSSATDVFVVGGDGRILHGTP